MGETVAIIGGGLAGLAAATALAKHGFQVTILEARARLGGRAGSFQDPSTGQLVDTCQHLSFGCCTNFSHFCSTVGIASLLQPQSSLYFMTPDGRISRFAADWLPVPMHLMRSFWRGHYLSFGEKLRIAYGLACLERSSPAADPPFSDWLQRHGQTPRTVNRFWGLILTSALNEVPERIGLRYARKVLIDGFLRHRRGFSMEMPIVPLGRFYGQELQQWLDGHHVRIEMNAAAKRLQIDAGRVAGMLLRSEQIVHADWYIATLPFDRLLDILPAEIVEEHACFRDLCRLETSPITSVHLWYDRPVLDLPHLVLIDCAGQWVFNRGHLDADEHYLQVVVSAARQFRGLGHEEVQRLIIEELSQLLPRAVPSAVKRARVITEHAATFSAVPGVDAWRPKQATPIANLFIAGDWTATGWPATMEGAVRSGYLAAEALLKKTGKEIKLVQPDL
jgi:squalene-associated FAD-dependent desaturase